MDNPGTLHREDGRILRQFEEDARPPSAGGEVVRLTSDLGMAARRLHVDAATGEGVCEFYRLEPGFYLLVSNLERRIAVASRVIGEDLVEFHYRLSGQLELSGRWGELAVAELAFLLWYQPSGYDDVYERVELTGRRDVSVGLYCTPDWLRRAFSERNDTLPGVISALIHEKQRETGLVYRLLPLSAAMPPVLDALVRNSFPGNMGLIQAKAKALELLCLSIDALGRSSGDPSSSKLRFTDRDLANVAQARAILAEEYAEPPRLAVLARRVGLNVAKLPHGFKRQYGETMNEFVRRTRLERARELLSSTDLQIGQVAAEVGYRHHSTFTTAFAEHFGIPPKAFVNGRRIYGKTEAATASPT